jgi:hypothetical protein
MRDAILAKLAEVEEMLQQWEADGCDRDDVVYEIDVNTVDA